jgi:excinuclease ABC subunit A
VGDALPFDLLLGHESLHEAELVDQSPIGRTPRSNPATYTGAIQPIRKLLASTDHAKRLKIRAKHFSFNARGGRCPACDGAGVETLEMQFLADVSFPCEECNGKRFKREVLEVRWKDKDIAQILDLTVDDALAFFGGKSAAETTARERLATLADVGLGYLRLGQSATTLSGGEAQRLKLASHLPKGSRKARKRVLFVFDEPTTGLHLFDVRTLLACLHRLVDAGHTVVVIEHHLSVLAAADHVIELGPGGGADGGRVVAAGTPEHVARVTDSPTAPYLARELDAR